MKVAGPHMETRSTKDKKDARLAFNDHMRLLDQITKETDKIVKMLKRKNQLKRRNSILATLVRMMREQGASDQSIAKALPALDEFARVVSKGAPLTLPTMPENPQQASAASEEALGLFL